MEADVYRGCYGTARRPWSARAQSIPDHYAGVPSGRPAEQGQELLPRTGSLRSVPSRAEVTVLDPVAWAPRRARPVTAVGDARTPTGAPNPSRSRALAGTPPRRPPRGSSCERPARQPTTAMAPYPAGAQGRWPRHPPTARPVSGSPCRRPEVIPLGRTAKRPVVGGGQQGQGERPDQEPEVSQGNVVEARVRQQVNDDAGEP